MQTTHPRRTIHLCYLGMIVLALVVNIMPPLFIPLKEQFGLSFEQLGRLILINFATQVTFDLLCGPLVDRLGAKLFIVGGSLLVLAGFWLFAFAPALFAVPYHGLIAGTIVYSMGGGIFELLLNPIAAMVPSARKEADMQLMHSFYAIGQLLVLVLTALAIFMLGARHWRLFVLAWTILPLLAALGFASIHIPRFVAEHERLRLRQLVRRPAYLACVAAIGLSGAAEMALAQWASAYAEKGLGYPKIVGDLYGCAAFALALGIGRVWMSLQGARLNLPRMMLAGASLCVAVYLVLALSPWPVVSLGACTVGGLAVSMLWPGLISTVAARYPQAGASMYAMMSAAGDAGCAIAPWLVGLIADQVAGGGALAAALARLNLNLSPVQLGMRAGILPIALAPLLIIALFLYLRRHPTDDPS